MESRLLNGFHDDYHFDDNYVKYEIASTSYWTGEHESLGLQLTETLDGILPISPTEVNEHCFEYDSSFVLNENYIKQNSNCSIDSNIKDFEAAYSVIENGLHVKSSIVEVLAVDPDSEYDTISNSDYEFSEIDEIERGNDNKDVYNQDHRDRTKSILNDDFESDLNNVNKGDEQTLTETKTKLCFNTLKESNVNEDDKQTLTETKLFFNTLTENSKKEFNYDNIKQYSSQKQQLFENEIDIKNFDLTEFITKDDYLFISQTIKSSLTNEVVAGTEVKIENEDENSDIDVDVETVHDIEEKKFDETIKNYQHFRNKRIEDDIIKDPSWTPPKLTKKTKTQENKKVRSKPIQVISEYGGNLKSNTENKINKIECSKTTSSSVILERKVYGLGRGKNISACMNVEMKRNNKNSKDVKYLLSSKKPITLNDQPHKNNKLSNACVENLNLGPTNEVYLEDIKKEIDVEKTKLNVQNVCDVQWSSKNYKNKEVNSIILNDHDYNKPLEKILSVKKKLNLEEYKRRRGVSTAGGDVLGIANNKNVCSKELSDKISHEKVNIMQKSSSSLNWNENQIFTQKISPVIQTSSLQITPTKKMILEKLKNTPLDPITEAKNKVLRLKELKKKAALDRIIDSTVSAKVGPVTKILPLEEIVKNSNTKNEYKITKKVNVNEYEEIIIVSVGLNTDLTIPPAFDRVQKQHNGTVNGASLFYNISDTLKKANSTENVKISSSSLIASIQDVALKKLNYSAGVSIDTDVNQEKCSTKKCDAEHGENKIIMHLPKNRIRLPKQTISTQTMLLPQFPLLQQLKSFGQKYKTTEKRRRFRKKRSSSYSSDDGNGNSSYHSSHSSYNSRSSSRKRSRRSNHDDENSLDRCRSRSNDSLSSSESGIGRRGRSRDRRKRYNCSTSNSRSRSRSRSTDDSRSRSTSTTSSISQSSLQSYSKSKSNQYRNHRLKSRSTSRAHYKRHERNVSPAVEERRIIYVGRIEQETTKEDLKRKFIGYGPIRQITFHYKDTGMKYGFVTFEKAQDAFQAIDNGIKDEKINMYDISFGGRRAFCGASYSDLDGVATNNMAKCSYPSKIQKVKEDSFEALLAKVKQKLTNNKKSTSNSNECSKNDKV